MIDHDSQSGQLAKVGLDADGIVAMIVAMPGLADPDSGTASGARDEAAS